MIEEAKVVALCAARAVGAPIAECARVARLPVGTVNHWLRLGRAFVEAEPAERVPSHAPYGDLYERMAAAHAEARQELRRAVLASKADDPRVALDYLKWLDGTEGRRAALVRTKAEAAAARAAQKALGTASSITLTLPACVSTPRTSEPDPDPETP